MHIRLSFCISLLIMFVIGLARTAPLFAHTNDTGNASFEVEYGSSLLFVGNVASPWSMLKSPQSRQNGVLAFGPSFPGTVFTVDLVDDNFAWIVGEQRSWSTIRSPWVTFRHRKMFQADVSVSQDLISLVRTLSQDEKQLRSSYELGLLFGQASHEMLDVDLHLLRGQGNVDLWVRTSLGSARHLQTLKAIGHGVSYEGTAPAFYLQYESVQVDRGSGWSFGGGVTWHGRDFRITVETFDAVGRITWPAATVRRGLINSRNEIIGKDGYPSFAPLGRGTKSMETWTTSPRSHWAMTYTPVNPRRWSGVSVQLLGAELIRVGSSFLLNPNLGLSVGVTVPGTTIDVGVDYKSWHIGIAVGAASLARSPSVGFVVRYVWR